VGFRVVQEYICRSKYCFNIHLSKEIKTVKFYYCYLILSIIIWGLSSPAGAGSPKTETKTLPLDLKGAVRLALEKSPLLSEAKAEVKISKSDYRSSLSAILPTISGDASQARKVINLQATGIASIFPGNSSNNLPNFSSIEKVGPFNVFDARANIDEVFLDFEAIYDIRASKSGVIASKHSFDNVRQLVQTNTVAAYIDVLRLDAEVRKTQSDVKTAKALLNQAEDLLKAGMATELDVKRARVQLLNDEQALLESENSHKVALMFLAKTIGISPATALTLEDRLKFEHVVRRPLEDLVGLAFRKRSDLLSLKASEKKIALLIKSARAELLPKVGIHADYGASGLTIADSVIPTWSILGFMKIPIFTGGRTLANIGRTRSQLTQTQSQIYDLSNQIEFEVRSAVLRLNSSAEQVDVARAGVDLADQSLSLSRDRFESGFTDNVEVVIAQNDLARARENLIRALFNYNQARVSLAKAIGDITLVYELR
jgi:outer membrane protein